MTQVHELGQVQVEPTKPEVKPAQERWPKVGRIRVRGCLWWLMSDVKFDIFSLQLYIYIFDEVS